MTDQRWIERARGAVPEHVARSATWRVLGNSAWLIVAEGGTRVVSLATILYLTRTLAPSGMGAVQFGLAVFAVMQLVSIGGTEALLTPDAARRPEALARLAGRSLLVGWSHFAIAAAVATAGAWTLGMGPDMRRTALVFAAAAGLTPVALRFAFVARERARIVGLGTLGGYVAFFVLCVATVRRADDVERVAVCWLVAVGLRATGQLAIFVRDHGALVFDRRGFGRTFRAATVLGLGSIARGLQLNVDVLVLGLVRPAAEVASYGLAIKLPLFVVSIATLFCTALFPVLARAVAAADAERVARIEATTIEAILGIALPGALCLWLVADPLTTILFTERFRDAAPLVALLVWRIPLVSAIGVLRTGVWARQPDLDARLAVVILVATVAILLVIASRTGATGVAAGMLATDAMALVCYAYAGGMPGLGRVRAGAVARLGLGVALGLGVMLAVPREAGVVTVMGALAAWGAATLVADAPHLRRLAGETSRRAAR